MYQPGHTETSRDRRLAGSPNREGIGDEIAEGGVVFGLSRIYTDGKLIQPEPCTTTTATRAVAAQRENHP